jgi:hypothetical protein
MKKLSFARSQICTTATKKISDIKHEQANDRSQDTNSLAKRRGIYRCRQREIGRAAKQVRAEAE